MVKGYSQAKSIKLKVYLEGIEFPSAAIQLVEQENSSPKAVIQIPANQMALDIAPRTTVHIFYTDSTMDDFYLIFEGEVGKIGIERHDDNRIVSLTCVNISDHWNYAVKDATTLTKFKGEITSKVTMSFTSLMDDTTVPSDLKEYRSLMDKIDPPDESLRDYYESLKNQNDNHQDQSFNNLLDSAQILVNSGSNGLALGFSGLAISLAKDSQKELDKVLKTLARDYANSNIGYTVFHIVYQMSKRFFGHKNKKIESLFETNYIKTFISQQLDNESGEMSLIGMMQKILRLFNYVLLAPTAPTCDETSGAPQSFITLPTPTLFAPIACNTIFKDEVINATFSRDYLSEPTRVASAAYPSIVQDESSQIINVLHEILVAPAGRLSYSVASGSDTAKAPVADIQMTEKERMRGINGFVINDDFAGLKATVDAEDEISKKQRTDKETSDSEEKKKLDKKNALSNLIKDLRIKYLDYTYQRMLLNSRSFVMTAQYSPYRICGLPGVYMDDILPCVMGTIASITTNFDGKGMAVSTIVFSSPKLIRPEEKVFPENLNSLTDYLRFMGLSEDELSLNERAKRYPFSYKDANSTETEVYTGTPEQNMRWLRYLKDKLNNPEYSIFLQSWYDEDTYFPNVIGSKVYSNIMFGVAPSKKFALKINTVRYIDETGNNKLDGGIGRYQEEDLSFNTETKNNALNTEYLAHYLRTLWREYSTHNDTDKLDFINKFTRRRLIREKEFWKFLINLPDDKIIADIDNIKSPEESNLGLGIRSIQHSIKDERERIKDLIDLNKVSDSNTTASAPFIKSRREIIQRLRKSLLFQGNFIGGN